MQFDPTKDDRTLIEIYKDISRFMYPGIIQNAEDAEPPPVWDGRVRSRRSIN